MFDVAKLDLPKYAESMGLVGVPKVKFLKSGSEQQGKSEDETKEDDNPPVCIRLIHVCLYEDSRVLCEGQGNGSTCCANKIR